MDFSIIDCTFRDGGYYTNWDFDTHIVDSYINISNSLPIDYIEIGYRNLPSAEYLGEFAFCPIPTLKRIKERSCKKIAVMLNAKSFTVEQVQQLLSPIQGLVDLIRFATDPQQLTKAIPLVQQAKKMGFEVSCSIMYMSKWLENPAFFKELPALNSHIDMLYMVDSYGSIEPNEISDIVKQVSAAIHCPLGFHGHNNLELSFANALAAIQAGVKFIDSTIMGMGRGAGNLKTELLLTYANQKCGTEVDFNALGKLVSDFTMLSKKYEWGTNLPYMLSGANSFPQKDVMTMLQNRLYSLNQIISVLENRKHDLQNSEVLPQFSTKKFQTVLIIGGGESAKTHATGISEFVKNCSDVAIIHATAKNAAPYLKLNVPQFFCVVGNEENRIASILQQIDNEQFIYAPSPRPAGTAVPDFLKQSAYELAKIEFIQKTTDSCTAVALQAAQNLSGGQIYIVGYDGYNSGNITETESVLMNENNELFDVFVDFYGVQLLSLTPTVYRKLQISSVYQNL